MAMGDGPGVLRLRGTFLDIGPDRPCQIRRHSSPPLEASIVPEDFSWVDSFTERSSDSFSQHAGDNHARNRAHKRASHYNTNEYDEPVTMYDLGHFHEGRACNSSTVGESSKFDGDTKSHAMGIPCHSPMTADSHAVTQSIESPLTTLSMAASSLSGETPAAAGEITTLMIYYIPERMTIEKFLDLIHSHGFANTYDLLYMPLSAKGQSSASGPKNLGYVFINFRKPEGAEAFANDFNDVRFPEHVQKKRCTTRPARFQGFEENMRMHTSDKSSGWLFTVGEDGVMKRERT